MSDLAICTGIEITLRRIAITHFQSRFRTFYIWPFNERWDLRIISFLFHNFTVFYFHKLSKNSQELQRINGVNPYNRKIN